MRAVSLVVPQRQPRAVFWRVFELLHLVETNKRLRVLRIVGRDGPGDMDDACADTTTLQLLLRLLNAAPRLEELHADVACDTAAQALMVLRNARPFGPLRVRRLCLRCELDPRVASALEAHASCTQLYLFLDAPCQTQLSLLCSAPLARQLRVLHLGNRFNKYQGLGRDNIRFLTHLLDNGALEELVLSGVRNDTVECVKAWDVLCKALRRCATLRRLTCTYWLPTAHVATLITELRGHPRLECLRLQQIDLEHTGAALDALLAADAPALRELHLEDCRVYDDTMRPMLHGLARNTHVHTLAVWENLDNPPSFDEDFLRAVLLPALRAAKHLRALALLPPDLPPDADAAELLEVCAELSEEDAPLVALNVELLSQLQREVCARRHDPDAARAWEVAYHRWQARAAGSELAAADLAAAWRRSDAAMAALLAEEELERAAAAAGGGSSGGGADRTRNATSNRKKKRGGKGAGSAAGASSQPDANSDDGVAALAPHAAVPDAAPAPVVDAATAASAAAEGSAAAAHAGAVVIAGSAAAAEEQPQSAASPPVVQPAPARRTAPRPYAPPPDGGAWSSHEAAVSLPPLPQHFAALSLGAPPPPPLPPLPAAALSMSPAAHCGRCERAVPALCARCHCTVTPLPPPQVECCICFLKLSVHELRLLAPCGHRCVCGECAGALLAAGRACPICDVVVICATRVFDL